MPPSLTPGVTDLLIGVCSAIGAAIGIAALRAIVLAGAVGVALAALRVKRPAIRLWAWTVILYAALAMPLLDRVIPSFRLPLPEVISQADESVALHISALAAHFSLPVSPNTSLITSRVTSPAIFQRASTDQTSSPVSPHDRTQTDAPAIPSAVPKSAAPAFTAGAHSENAAAGDTKTFPWALIVMSVYLVGALILLVRAWTGWAVAKGLEGAAIPLHDADVFAQLCERADVMGVKQLPRLVQAEALRVPLTLSAIHPVILLPAGWRAWEPGKLDAVLTHELAHIARGDVMTQRLSLLYRALFWFSPLSWWLHRSLAALAEQASDEAALHAGADQAQYAETLLGFFAEMQQAKTGGSRRIRWQALAMARGSEAERRVENILSWKNGVSERLTRPAALGIALLAVPAILLSASLRPTVSANRLMGSAVSPSNAPTAGSPIASLQPFSTATSAIPFLTPDVPLARIANMGNEHSLAVETTSAEANGERRAAGEQNTSALSPAAPIQPDLSPCGPAINQCQPVDLNRMAWLKMYADRTTFEVTSDNRFQTLVLMATPLATFHFGYDMPLSDVIDSLLTGPAFPVQFHDQRYLMIYATASGRGRTQAFYWFDLEKGVTFGGIFFYPTNGELTPSLTIFSRQVGDVIHMENQLPSTFLRDLERWRAARNVPAITARYFVNGNAWKSVLMHGPEKCGQPAGGADASACQKINEERAELDMQAAYHLIELRYAEGTPALANLKAEQDKWAASRNTTCANKADAAACRAQMTRDRAKELDDIYSQAAPARPRAY